MLSISSQATWKLSGIEEICKSSSWLPLGGESKGTGLNRQLLGAEVDSTAPKVTALAWPDVGRTLLKPLRPVVLGIGKCPYQSSSNSYTVQGIASRAVSMKCPLVTVIHDSAEGL